MAVRSVIALGLCASLVSGCAGYGTFLREELDIPITDGTMSETSSVGITRFAIAECYSGEHERFFGVTLYSSDHLHAVRIVQNPIGPITVAVPGQNGYYEPLSCPRVVGALRPLSSGSGKVQLVSGQIQFVCDRLKGSAVFGSCT
jgi:hypothetical protein